MRMNCRTAFLLMSTALIIPLSACQTTSGQYAAQGDPDRTGAAFDGSANDTSGIGNTRESLASLERSYKQDSSNVDLAARYARALRQENRPTRAVLVLTPFMEGRNGGANAAAHVEYAASMAAMGKYEDAEKHAREAVTMEPENGQAYHVLGIALDAMGHHPQAETAFRRGLEFWQGDPSPILNNLGLNLASQGFIDEALDTLRKAAAVAPNRDEIERNMRIVSALQVQPAAAQATSAAAIPKPLRKPAGEKPQESTKPAEPAATPDSMETDPGNEG